jgi:hypothetical protein
MNGRMIVSDKLETMCQKVEYQGKTPFRNLLRLTEEIMTSRLTTVRAKILI